jgi:DNA-binding MarR family transcriptional regulator
VLSAACARAGLKPRRCQAVLLLDEHGRMTQREHGEAMCVDPSILVGLLNPLEEEGLIWAKSNSSANCCHARARMWSTSRRPTMSSPVDPLIR